MARYVNWDLLSDKLRYMGYFDESEELELTAQNYIEDVTPIIHGKWTRIGKCTNCDYLVQPWNIGTNFCPNCGAKMDKE